VENGINLKVIWFDEVEDLLEVVFSCSNGFFSGQAEIYVSCDDLSEFADSFTRFPSRPDDSRDFELGTFNPDHAGRWSTHAFLLRRCGGPCSR